MALVEEYYELNEAEEVLVIWKVLQIVFYISAACLGLWCGYTIALLRFKFEDKCYLFTSIKNLPLEDDRVNYDAIDWESDSWCDYCQYSMVSSFIVATIWATFFLMCGKGGKSITGLPQPWRIVWPSLIFNFIYFIVALSTAINIQQGTDFFCLQVDVKENVTLGPWVEDCPTLRELGIDDEYIVSVQLEIVTKASWACVISWLMLFLISFSRIIFVIDFNLYKICVFKIGEVIHNRKEEVLKITNYEEPKRVHFDSSRQLNSSEMDERLDKNSKGRSRRNFPMELNTAFYVTTDIRMLHREKQRKAFKFFDQAFDQNKSYFGIKQINKQPKISYFDISQLPSFSYQYDLTDLGEPAQDHNTDNKEKSTVPYKINCSRKKNDTASPSTELAINKIKTKNFINFKKCI